MNIFPFDPSPRTSARALDDKRLCRVFQEAVMMQCNVQRYFGEDAPYKASPMPLALQEWLGLRLNGNDPNTVKARQWLYNWMHYLAEENMFRFDAASDTSAMQAFTKTMTVSHREPLDGLVFCNMAKSDAKGLDYTAESDVHIAYRAYVAYQWIYRDKRPVVWTRRGNPSWFDPAKFTP